MSFMDKIAKIDSAMQRGLDNSFALVFGGRVVPAEIEELLKQEVQDNLLHTYEGTIEAPNFFRVGVSKKDAANLSENHPDLPLDFADQLTRYERNQGWVTSGIITVLIEVDSSLRTGQLKAHSDIDPTSDGNSRFVGIETYDPTHNYYLDHSANPHDPGIQEAERQFDVADQQQRQWPSTEHIPSQAPLSPPTPGHNFGGVTAQAAPAERTPSVSLLLQDGSSRTYHVHSGSNIIGRSNDADFRLPDTGVSRKHAEITWNGRDAILVDLQSTNGTTVNETPIDNWLLADGDVITVGRSNIEVRINRSA
ncbi:DUF3662 and FHA domain-containing protein [Corynebacterium sp. sy039]|uniref:DUF3662 and FHA domain-containing protein n=1 Tax=Corynebacterium sp. sy039 TaxID=2599641 RepID=UPI0011B66EBB|nr:DUF3662 and FHA domain-containing protein [Corynebacterium sp. sy039]QDZ41765.1 DUF2662 domain-containing protein [Corynebacterium sp. sy039]